MFAKLSLKVTLSVVMLGMLLVSGTGLAQETETENELKYGDQVESTITNSTFEELYTFTGEAGDIVKIEMMAGSSAGIDPQLFLATLDNDLLTSNDDAFNRDSRIVYQLPEDATYLIVATRLSGRFGSDEGDYTLTLSKIDPISVDVTNEGQVSSLDEPPTLVFTTDTPGSYTVTYQHVQGRYYPALVILRSLEDATYQEEVGRVDGIELENGTITLNFETEAIYVLSLVSSSYSYYEENETALYTIRVGEAPR